LTRRQQIRRSCAVRPPPVEAGPYRRTHRRAPAIALPEQPRTRGAFGPELDRRLRPGDRADFVPPDQRARPMADLVDHMTGHIPLDRRHRPCQFETIPTTDGNGRVGRASSIPSSPPRIDRARPTDQPRARDLARHLSTGSTPTGTTGPECWASTSSTHGSTPSSRPPAFPNQSETLKWPGQRLQSDWVNRLSSHRISVGLRAAPRADRLSRDCW
jgi:hypothetical protein